MNQFRPLRILEVSEPNCDGVFIHVRGLLQYLVGRGHHVTYAYSSNRSSSQLAVLLDEIKAHGAVTKDLKIGNRPSLSDVRAMSWLVWRIFRDRPDVVHGHSSKAGVLIRFASILLRKPVYFYTPHAYYSMDHKPSGLSIIYWWIERCLASRATTINISRDERHFAVEKLGLAKAPFVIAPNPVASLFRFSAVTAAEKKDRRAALDIPTDSIVLGTVARFTAQKDPETFYRAAIEAAKKCAKLHFCHLGSGAGQEKYRKLVADEGLSARFTWVSYLPDPSSFYSVLDGFALTSRFEAGWPIVMLEALAVGLPLLTTDYVGLGANDVGELSHVWIAPVGERSLMATYMVKLAELLENGEIVTNHRKYISDHFAPDVCYGIVERNYLERSICRNSQ